MDTAPALSVVAAAPREKYNADWFMNPGFQGPTPFTVERSGRVYGHLATFGVCHIGIDKQCIQAPRSKTDYAYFHLGEVQTTEGPLPVGTITLNTGHADLSLNYADTAAHYDHTGTIAAVVRAGEDEHGVWIAGALCDVDEDTVRTLQASGGLSGDWRSIGGNLELVAALAVNVPGFPVPRPALAASGEKETALVAANMLMEPIDNGRSIQSAIIEAMDERDARNARRAKVADLRKFRARQMREKRDRLLRV